MSGFHYSREPNAAGQIIVGEGPAAGLPLDRLLDRGRPGLRTALEIAAHVADIQCVALEDQAVHGDLRPAHVRVAPNGAVSVEGYGILRRVTRAPEGRPEQPSADVYGLGLLVYTMTSGEPFGSPPREARAHDEYVQKKVQALDLGKAAQRRWAPDLRAFLTKLLAWAPAERPAPLDAANIFASIAQQCPGEDAATWMSSRSFPVTDRGAVSSGDDALGGPVTVTGFFPKAGGPRTAPSTKGESTTFWTKDRISATFHEVTPPKAPPGARAPTEKAPHTPQLLTSSATFIPMDDEDDEDAPGSTVIVSASALAGKVAAAAAATASITAPTPTVSVTATAPATAAAAPTPNTPTTPAPAAPAASTAAPPAGKPTVAVVKPAAPTLAKTSAPPTPPAAVQSTVSPTQRPPLEAVKPPPKAEKKGRMGKILGIAAVLLLLFVCGGGGAVATAGWWWYSHNTDERLGYWTGEEAPPVVDVAATPVEGEPSAEPPVAAVDPAVDPALTTGSPAPAAAVEPTTAEPSGPAVAAAGGIAPGAPATVPTPAAGTPSAAASTSTAATPPPPPSSSTSTTRPPPTSTTASSSAPTSPASSASTRSPPSSTSTSTTGSSTTRSGSSTAPTSSSTSTSSTPSTAPSSGSTSTRPPSSTSSSSASSSSTSTTPTPPTTAPTSSSSSTSSSSTGAAYKVTFTLRSKDPKVACDDGQKSSFAGNTILTFKGPVTCTLTAGTYKGTVKLTKAAKVSCTEGNEKIICSVN